jgi:serine-type D-Ala-D-Ala carboxypeptidase/endopeptidase (penicillin-binding protein 4)
MAARTRLFRVSSGRRISAGVFSALKRALLCAASCSVLCSATDLEHRIDALLESRAPVESNGAGGRGAVRAQASVPARGGHVGINVIQLSTGKTLYHRNEDQLFLPASNMKLFTSALALLRLGPDYRFTTRLRLETPDDSTAAGDPKRGGELIPGGDLILIGGGDPSVSGRVFPYDKDSGAGPGLRAIEDLADQAVKAGLTRVNGDVVGDDRLYPWAPYAPNWTQDDTLREFGAPVSALTVNENTMTLLIRPGSHAGDMAELALDPAIEYYAIDNRLVTVGARAGNPRASNQSPEPAIRISRSPGSRQIEVWGSIPAGRERIAETLTIDDPALYAACALYDALTRRGVAISGRPVARHRTVFEDQEPSSGRDLASRTSPPLLQLLQVMDKVSQNLFAELMLRETGRVTRHRGTREAGVEELSALIGEIGGGKDDARLDDGSGLSRNALVTPRLFTRLLAHMNASKYRDEWLSLLPIGGEDGTLRRRFAESKAAKGSGPADPSGIRAKTGSLARALALSGYAESKTQGRLAFSILVNDFAAPQSEVRAWIDKIALALLE